MTQAEIFLCGVVVMQAINTAFLWLTHRRWKKLQAETAAKLKTADDARFTWEERARENWVMLIACDDKKNYWQKRATEAEANAVALCAENTELRARLPEGMEHCTIQFKECDKGHGRLVVTNWIDHGCPHCRREELEAQVQRAFPPKPALAPDAFKPPWAKKREPHPQGVALAARAARETKT